MEGGLAVLLRVENLTISYRIKKRKVSALREASLEVDYGEVRAIVGESGSGKSTLAFAILRLLPENAIIESGSIIFEGRDLLKLPESELRKIRGREIGMVFQNPSTTLNPVMRACEHVAELFNVHLGLDEKESIKRSVDILFKFGIPEDRVFDYPHQLSGGMKQRVCISMAVALSPKLIIADEPTTALDVLTQAQVLKLLKRLRDEHRVSIMFITHDLSLAATISDNITVMYLGEIVEEGPTDILMYEPTHPYTRELLECIPRITSGRRGITLSTRSQEYTISTSADGCVYAPRCVYARERCFKEKPPYVKLGNKARVRCWLYA